jgi:hypothetical protein
VNVLKAFENSYELNFEEWLQSYPRESNFQYMTNTDITESYHRTKGCGRRDESEEERKNNHVSYSVVLQCDDTLLDYMGQWGFECSDITAFKCHENSKRTKTNKHYYSICQNKNHLYRSI